MQLDCLPCLSDWLISGAKPASASAVWLTAAACVSLIQQVLEHQGSLLRSGDGRLRKVQLQADVGRTHAKYETVFAMPLAATRRAGSPGRSKPCSTGQANGWRSGCCWQLTCSGPAAGAAASLHRPAGPARGPAVCDLARAAGVGPQKPVLCCTWHQSMPGWGTLLPACMPRTLWALTRLTLPAAASCCRDQRADKMQGGAAA